MEASLMVLAAAAFVFLALHLGIAGTKLRDTIVGTVGEGAYMGLFSIASLAGIVWLSMAYNEASATTYVETWGQLVNLHLLASVIMFFAFMLAVPGILTPSPTGVGGEGQLDKEEPATGMTRISRHPFLWGTFLWAFSHLLVNGDLASLIMFGTFALLTALGTRSIDAKRKRKLGEKWDAFAAQTSNIPFAAIVSGRNSLRLGEIGWWRLAVAFIAYLAVFGAHGLLFSVMPDII